MKTLVIVAHPDLAQSTVNRRWIAELQKHPDRFTVHDLYRACPDSRIDVQREQALVESHAHLVLQFPVYWFSSPPLLKQWQDEVLTYGWAYGSTGHALKGRKVGIAVSAGTPANAASALKERKARTVTAYCTHAILSGNAIENIEKSGMDQLIVTDSVPLREAAKNCKKIRVLSIAGLVAESIRRIHVEESISSLFVN